MIDQLPQYRAHLSRHGHNLNHKFDFTSSTGHLLTLFSQIMNPKETISGKIDMFSRTQPLNSPSHVDIDTYIDYFFVPLDMIYSGFGDTLYQTNEPYSSMISVSPNTLPLMVFDAESFVTTYMPNVFSNSQNFRFVNFNTLDYYEKDSLFMSVYRNLFHNYLNPNFIFSFYAQSLARALPADTFQPNILPLDLLAYNCVYENFYRLDEREQFDNTLYNIDSSVYQGSNIVLSSSIKDFSLKYRPLSFDYFTSAKVAPLINGLNIKGNNGINTDLTAINNYLSLNNISLSSRQDTGGTFPLQGAAGTGLTMSGSSIINTNSLRSMFAVEKILSVTGRAKKTYDAQVMAHLGVPVPRDIKHEITFIGSQCGSIKIGEIISVAGTEDTPLGDMAGKGYGTLSNKPIKFTAPCHGIFIAIYSAVPKLSYYSPLEKAHCITSRLDFWHPEFEKLGMQPIFGYEVVPFQDTAFRSSVFGWQMRYEQYKRKFDKVSPAFSTTIINMGIGVNPTDIDYRSDTFNTWKNWVLSIRPFRQQGNSTSLVGVDGLKRFLSSPTDLNDIMSISYGWFNDSVDVSVESDIPDYWKIQGISAPVNERTSFGWNVASLFYRDPLLHFANIDFKLVSSMGENTLPDLNC